VPISLTLSIIYYLFTTIQSYSRYRVISHARSLATISIKSPSCQVAASTKVNCYGTDLKRSGPSEIPYRHDARDQGNLNGSSPSSGFTVHFNPLTAKRCAFTARDPRGRNILSRAS